MTRHLSRCAFAVALRSRFRRAAGARRQQDRARRIARRHRGLAGARARRAAGRDGLRLHGRRQRRIRPTSRASPTWWRRCSTKAPASSTRRRSRSAWRRRRSSSASRPAAISSAARCARSRRTCDEAFDLLRLALTAPRFDAERGRAHPRADARRAAPRDHQSERASPTGAGGRRRFPDHPYGRPTNGTLGIGRRASPPTTCKTYARRVFARDTLKIGDRRRHRRRRPPAS